MVKIGIELYSIELDGCLNGVYTNEDADGHICNEIAIKYKTDLIDPLCGTYQSTFFEGPQRHNGMLTITRMPGKIRTYGFTWTDEAGTPKFTGTGYKMNERQVAVRYESV